MGKLKLKSKTDHGALIYFRNDKKGALEELYQLDERQLNYSPLFAANMAFGYSINSYRVELEGMYSSIDVSNVGFGSKRMIVHCQEKIQEPISGFDKLFYHVCIDYNPVENKSVIANIYRHWKNDHFSFSPYIGAGVGVTKMKMFGKTSAGLAYQLKTGLDYYLNKYISMRVGYRYFGAVVGNLKFKTVLLQKPAIDREITEKRIREGTLDAESSLDIERGLLSTHGIEIGLNFHFASKTSSIV
ncbi:MAG: P44/Msp2 family outer membrane protein [Rickettsiales bacterium]|jgi:opacity protein-like surface antigen|nr:P44/Msp2 family outer membrane protein [Rickettsiales bacterium]